MRFLLSIVLNICLMYLQVPILGYASVFDGVSLLVDLWVILSLSLLLAFFSREISTKHDIFKFPWNDYIAAFHTQETGN